MISHTYTRSPHGSRRMSLAAWYCICLLLAAVSPAHAASTTWQVNRPGDSASDGDLVTQSGTLRFALAHAASGDLVSFGDVGADTIAAQSTLVVPAGVTVGRGRDLDCGSYKTPLATIVAPIYLGPSSPLPPNPVVILSAGSTWRNVNIAGGDISVRVIGAGVDLCGAGLGLEVDGDGVITALPPWHAALIVDGAGAIVHRNYLGGAVVVASHGSDTRIGDTIDGSGDSNDGIRDASVSVLTDATDSGGACANSTSAAQRVIIRDRFPRGLACLEKPGVSGGDDVISHVNNWSQTPTILSARTNDGVTVQISGTANPGSVVDLYLDYQTEIDRRTVLADALGTFSNSGPLPAGQIWVSAASTLADPAHPARSGSSSEWSAATAVISSTAEPLLSSLGGVVDLSGIAAGPAHVGDLLRFSVTMVNSGPVDVSHINSTVFQAPASVTILAHSHKITGGTGFIATDSGFLNGMLAPGQTAIYSVDAVVNPSVAAGMAVFSLDVNGDGIVSTPVVGRMRIATGPSFAPQQRVWISLVR